MKTLELDLKKKVLIVDENDFDYYELSENGIYFKLEKGDRYYLGWKFEVLCKGSELTEEMASELVETHKNCKRYIDYTIKERNRFFDLSIPSFISAVESKEKFWLENPIKIIERGEDTEHNRVLNQNKWQEAEEKTFKNPLIFVKK